jgi:ribonucleotide reductase beta subunit family protein with ferritin-like domain
MSPDPLMLRSPGGARIPARSDGRYAGLWQLYKKHVASFWTVQEIDLAADLLDWAKLKEEERHFVTHVLAFFAASDGIVLENINLTFASEVQIPEARAFYGFQAAMENVHSETYSTLIQSYIQDPDQRAEVFDAIHTMPAVRLKADWATQWMDRERPFAERLVAFACVEGVLFSGSFCAIFWLKKRGLMPGLSLSNQLISRDEGLHCDFACALYGLLEVKLSQAMAERIVAGAVAAEESFICEALPCDLIGMSRSQMTSYIRFVADRLLTALGHAKLYEAKNPFDWMDMISMQGKTNFFEARVAEYQKPHVMSGADGKGFSLDEDF